MVVLSAKPIFLRAFVCALGGMAAASFAQSPHKGSPGIASESVTADLGPESAKPRESLPPTNSGNPLWSVPLTSLSATRDRPIFSPSRHPPPQVVVAAPYVAPPPPPPAPPPEPDRPLLTLLGVVAGDTVSVGIFTDQSDKPPFNLRIGEGYQGWVLRTVRGREAIFEKSNRTATLTLVGPESPAMTAGNGRGGVPPKRTAPAPTPSPITDPNFWNR
jgi:hypothetical protein